MPSGNLLYNKILDRVRSFGDASGAVLQGGLNAFNAYGKVGEFMARPTTRTLEIGKEVLGNTAKIATGQKPQFSYPEPGIKGALQTAGDVASIAGTASTVVGGLGLLPKGNTSPIRQKDLIKTDLSSSKYDSAGEVSRRFGGKGPDLSPEAYRRAAASTKQVTGEMEAIGKMSDNHKLLVETIRESTDKMADAYKGAEIMDPHGYLKTKLVTHNVGDLAQKLVMRFGKGASGIADRFKEIMMAQKFTSLDELMAVAHETLKGILSIR